MHIGFAVNGYYDWESADLHPGIQITPADVKALRAKQDAQGKWLVRVEVSKESEHGAHIPEMQICYFMLWQAVHAGIEWSRHDAACELMKHSYKHWGRMDHIVDAHVGHDHGPSADIMTEMVARCISEYRTQLGNEALFAAAIADALVATGLSADCAKSTATQAVAGANSTALDASLRSVNPTAEVFAAAKAVLDALRTPHDENSDHKPVAPYAADSDLGKAALAAAQSMIDATIASAQKTADAVHARYVAAGPMPHHHVKAHFAPHQLAKTAAQPKQGA